jgi:hypothetical protein
MNCLYLKISILVVKGDFWYVKFLRQLLNSMDIVWGERRASTDAYGKYMQIPTFSAQDSRPDKQSTPVSQCVNLVWQIFLNSLCYTLGISAERSPWQWPPVI